ncbi:MAG: hypothetical protein OXI87_00940 [Albidovulum sp.]|nr:hypothetical protein [Albidovulum sp.]
MPVAKSLQSATLRHLPEFITPRASVAGAVVDDMIRKFLSAGCFAHARVNRGGDDAFHLSEGEKLRISISATDRA